MRIAAAVLTGWLVTIPAVGLAEDEPLHLLQNGSFHGDEITPLGEDIPVIALHQQNDRATLEKEAVSITIERDEVMDLPDQKTGKAVKRVRGDLNREPLVMIHASALKTGEVPQATQSLDCLNQFHQEKGNLPSDLDWSQIPQHIDMAPYNTRPCALKLGDAHYQLRLESSKLTDGAYPAYVVDVVVTQNGVSQTFEGVSDILFAGDLDRDGKLDLLVDRIDHYNVWVHKVLFLSSYAKSGELMRRVGSLLGVGC